MFVQENGVVNYFERIHRKLNIGVLKMTLYLLYMFCKDYFKNRNNNNYIIMCLESALASDDVIGDLERSICTTEGNSDDNLKLVNEKPIFQCPAE